MSNGAGAEPMEFQEWLRFEDRPPDDTGVGPARAVETEGRCYGCWGPIAGLRRKEDPCTRLECLICGSSVDGEEAQREMARMQRETAVNLPLVRVGHGSRYSKKARFVVKLLPEMDRDMARYEQHLATSLRTQRRKSRLDRNDFPLGAAGHLFAQAALLVAGLNSLPRELSAPSLSDVEYGAPEDLRVEPTGGEDGTVRVIGRIPAGCPKLSDAVLKSRMGTLMLAGSMAAFACELAMKALLMTREHGADKTHDLASLYAALPTDCRERLEGDFGEIVAVLEDNRHTFGQWRYFEQALGGKAIGALVDTHRVRGLAKSARVLLDECVVAGLDYKIAAQMDTELAIDSGEVVDHAARVSLSVEGKESAVAWDALLSAAGGKTSPRQHPKGR